ncbi:MAG TPA: thiamine diphosphokinase [Candidatus Kapabacteria bacterium]|nr:thiamine diphosphokinase [Candidatus Kapabacteria bacterium]
MIEQKNTLLLLDGEEPSATLLSLFASRSQFNIATDGAARTAKKNNIPLDVIIGDLDSLDNKTREHYSNSIIIELEDQYSNDFEKALRHLMTLKNTALLMILGLHGKRVDHTLTNLSVLTRFRNEFENVICIDDFQSHYLLTELHPFMKIDAPKNSLVSLTTLPLAATVISEGLKYPLNGGSMTFGMQDGLSNVVNSDSGATIRISSGHLLVSIEHHGAL